MARYIKELTPAQTERMGSFAQEWIDRGYRTRPLTEEEWTVVERGMEACYGFAGLPWHGTVIRVPNPLVGAFAAPIAAFVINQLRKQGVIPGSAVRSAVGSAVGSAVDSAVGSAVGSAVRSAVRSAVGSAVDSAVRSAVGSAVDSAVGSAVRSAVRSAVDSAVRSAVDIDPDLANILRYYWYRFGGRHWSGWWDSYIAYFRDVAELELDGDLWARSRAYEDAQGATWWWPFRDFVMVCDVPTSITWEANGGSARRLHSETGHAIEWADGWGLNFWHGIRVPEDFYSWDIERALAERNSEVRRCAIERLGWETVVDRLILVATAVDPGNEPHEIALYDLPAELADLYEERARILVVRNASLDKGGHRRVFGLPVPAHHDDPVDAAADLFGVPPAAYARTVRAS